MAPELLGLSAACHVPRAFSAGVVLALCAFALSAFAAAPRRARWPVHGQLPLNLEALFDNDAMADARDRADGNFDCPDHAADIPGSTYPAENLPASGTAFMLDGIWYLFPSKEPGDNNNVACNGQNLRVPAGRYTALHVVGSSENGNFKDTLRLSYKEGPGEVELALTDWCQAPGLGEKVAFEAACRYTYSSQRQGVVREAVRPRLFVQTIRLDGAKTLEGIGLPYKRRMHIFCATLEAVGWSVEQSDYAHGAAEAYEAVTRRVPLSVEAARGKLASLAAELDALGAGAGELARQFGWLRTQVAYLERQAGTRRARGVGREVRSAATLLRRLQDGNDPFPALRGCFLRSYVSPLDGSRQSYSLAVPNDYTGEKPFPLFVSLHGHGWYRPFQGHPQRAVDGVILAAPHGRGSIDYMLAAEADVLTAVDEVMRDYRIDPDRVVLEGHSMGGTGSWQLGVHYPHRFAAIAPVCGNADRRAWDAWKPKRKREPHPIPPRFQTLRTYVLDSLDPITYAGNLANLPAFAGHGAWDDVVPVGHSRNMAARLKELGCTVEYHEFPFTRHWGFPQRFYDARWAWMMAQRRAASPASFRYKTAALRHNQAYWARIDRFVGPLAFAEIDVRHLGEARIKVATKNVAAFTLDLARSPAAGAATAEVEIDGLVVRAKGTAPSFARSPKGRWSLGMPPGGPAKKKGLEGPIGDVFLGSFLLVRGTTSPDPWEREVIRREVEARAHDWERMYNCRPRVKDDVAITKEDMRLHHLALYGGPAANAVTARIADKLPIRIEADRIRVGERVFEGRDVGVKLVYPNPFSPSRYVAVFAGLSADALHQVNNRFGNWFGWGPYDNYEWFDYGVFDARSYDPESFLCVGFFDQRWQLDERHQFPGDAEARAAMLPRRVPRLRELPTPAPPTLYLSDLAPTLIDQHKGTVGFDRSFEGNPLELGRRTFPRGLGVRAPSKVEWDVGGGYTTFRATVGIDLEGALEVSKARARGEWVQFLVFGDGKRLYSSEWLQWDSAPADVEVEIRDVKVLRLEVGCSSARWLVGSADWAEARVSAR